MIILERVLEGITGSHFFGPLLGLLLLAGLGLEVRFMVADGMSKLLGNDSLMNLWYDNFQRDPNSGNWSDALFLGLPAFLPTLWVARCILYISSGNSQAVILVVTFRSL